MYSPHSFLLRVTPCFFSFFMLLTYIIKYKHYYLRFERPLITLITVNNVQNPSPVTSLTLCNKVQALLSELWKTFHNINYCEQCTKPFPHDLANRLQTTTMDPSGSLKTSSLTSLNLSSPLKAPNPGKYTTTISKLDISETFHSRKIINDGRKGSVKHKIMLAYGQIRRPQNSRTLGMVGWVRAGLSQAPVQVWSGTGGRAGCLDTEQRSLVKCTIYKCEPWFTASEPVYPFFDHFAF